MRATDHQISESAREILRANDRGGFTVPTRGLYPHQWNWDSAFVALGLATFDESRACAEFETLFDAQWDDGFLPHIVFRRDDPDYFPGPSVWNAGSHLPTSGITQPPVAASIVNSLWRTATDGPVKNRLSALFPKVLAWHRWFHKYRVGVDCAAATITHPWESGRDNSAEWEAPSAAIDTSAVKPYRRRDLQHAGAEMRPTDLDYDRYLALVDFGRKNGWDHEIIGKHGPFRVADVGTTMILLRANRDLAQLADDLGYSDARNELEGYIAQLEAGVDCLWDDGARTFCSRDMRTGRLSGLVTNTSFLCYYAGAGSPAQRRHMAVHWERMSHSVAYMAPSHDPDDSRFDAVRYWRGPVWIVVNYMLAKGFEENGLFDWAERLRTESRRLIGGHGFREAFSPMSGSGTGGDDFSWTAAMWLAWCGESR